MLKRCLAKLFSLIVVKKIESTYNKAPELQAKILKQLIKKVEIYFGKLLVDRQYGLWMHIWSELTHTTDKKNYLILVIILKKLI